MKLEDHVLSAIDSYERGKQEEALLHACFAIDSIAKKISRSERSGATLYKDCLRRYYPVLEAFSCPGINLSDTKWTNIDLYKKNGKKIENPDTADVIYHVYRCSQAHAEEIPWEYSLISPFESQSILGVDIENKRLHLSDKIIWGLLAIAVFSNVNAGINTYTPHYLLWENAKGEVFYFLIALSWGREDVLLEVLKKGPFPRIKLAGL